MHPSSRPRRRLDATRRWLACLCLLPLALAGVGAGSGLWLLHEHGDEGLHGHAGGVVAVHDPHAADSWHDRTPGTTAGDRGDAPAGTPAPDDDAVTVTGHEHAPGVLVERPTYLTLARPTWLACLESLDGARPWGPHAIAVPADVETHSVMRPPGDAEPCGPEASGATRVLRTSHALLI